MARDPGYLLLIKRGGLMRTARRRPRKGKRRRKDCLSALGYIGAFLGGLAAIVNAIINLLR